MAGLIEEWGVAIIATIIGALFVWLLDLLPPAWQIHKRLSFAAKIKKIIANSDLSIPLENELSEKKLKNILLSIQKDIPLLVKRGQKFVYQSKDTGTIYSFKPNTDIQKGEELFFLIINSSNCFNTNLFGFLIGKNTFIEEMEYIVSKFEKLRKNQATITLRMEVTPRDRFLFSKRLKEYIFQNQVIVNYKNKNSDIHYNIRQIKIVSNGTAYLRKLIGQVFSEWLATLL